MSHNNMELMVWGDGIPRLTFWDSLHGKDRVYVLNKDGTATLETCEEDEKMGMFQASPCSLVAELRNLAFALSKRAEAEIQQMAAA